MGTLTRYNIAISVIVALGTYSFGFGFGVFFTSIGQPGFYVDLKLDPSSSYTASVLGAVNALCSFGCALGSIASGFIADKWGRKTGLGVGAVSATIGAALTAGSPYVAMLIPVRILQGIGLGMLICLVPLYLTETAPARFRGVLAGMTVMGFGAGYMAVAWVSVGTYFATNLSLQWRLPLALAALGPLGLLIGLYFVPETPRYLCWINKSEEALQVIKRLHHDANDPDDLAAHAEFLQIKYCVEHDRELKSGYREMFTEPSWRRRSILVMFLMFASQCTGVNGIANYLIRIFGSLGLEGAMPLVVYGIYSIVGTAAALVACFTMDLFGRRTLFLIGFPALAINLLIESLLQWRYVGTDSKAGNIAAVAFIFLFIINFQFIDAPSFVWCSEIWPTNLRSKGIALSMFAYFTGSITWSAPGPLAFRNIKWKMYLIFMGLCIICELLVYLYVPETRGKPVEEMGEIFGDRVDVHITSDGRGLVEKSEAVVEHAETVTATETA